MRKLNKHNTDIVAAPEAAPSAHGERRATAQPCGAPIALESDILERFRRDLLAGGFVGELNTASALYLIVSSRVLNSPVSTAVKGESAAGKSYAVKAVLKFFPKAAYLPMTAASDQALFYLNEPLSHRVLVFGEQHGMSSEKLNYYVRELLSNGYIEKYTVQSAKGGARTRKVKTTGPTSFVTTSTSDLHPENETRLLALNIDESCEGTSVIMTAIARKFDGSAVDQRAKYSKAEWKQFQTWLSHQDVQVQIPFAQQLAALIEPTSIRLRRDFEKLLNLISVHTLLHRQTRKVGPRGIIAEIKDYRAIWKILRKVFALSMEQSVDPMVRQTVEAVRDMGSATVTVEALAKALGIDKSNAGRRFLKAEKAGFLMNRGHGPGRPYAIATANPLPADDAVLPTPKELRRAVKQTHVAKPKAN